MLRDPRIKKKLIGITYIYPPGELYPVHEMTTLEHLDHYTTQYIATFLPFKSIKALSQTSKDMSMRVAHNSRELARTCTCCADGPPLEERIPVRIFTRVVTAGPRN